MTATKIAEEMPDGPQEQIAVDGAELHAEDQTSDKCQLSRQLSAPARLRQPLGVLGGNSIDRSKIINEQTSVRHLNRLRLSHGKLRSSTTTKHSHSLNYHRQQGEHHRRQQHQQEQHHHHQHQQQHQHQHQQQQQKQHQQQQQQQQAQKASALSSSSSSASDSAFSRSQTTLGSESEHSTSGFTNARSSLGNDSNESASDLLVPATSETETTTTTTACCDDDDDDEDEEAEERLDSSSLVFEEEDHFQIIWRNLSYKLPEKRLTRLTTCLAEHFDALKRGRQLINKPPPQAIVVDNVCDTAQRHVDMGPLGVEELEDSPAAAAAVSVAHKQRQVIFSGLNGCVRSGQLTAILGPSGAGKTTFLKCLTNSIVKGVTGSIDIIGGSTTSHQLKLCIIPQKDYLFDNLTVMETLLFASRIKNTKTAVDHKANVHRVADLLGLQACMKIKTSKLSGGQYKRVSIAQELLSQPDILILDEPTSGLDSLTCFKTVSVLRDLVDRSRDGRLPPLAIVMTIHQPQVKIFNLFHHVYVLSSMGQCVYEGTPELLEHTVAHCCNLYPPPDDQNAASFIIDLASELYGSKPIEQLIQIQGENFIKFYRKLPSLQAPHITNTTNKIDGNNNQKSNNLKLQVAISGLQPPQGDLKKPSVPSDAGYNCLANLELFNNNGGGGGGGEKQPNQLKISERLRKRNNHEHSFWRHTNLLIRRLWISMWRDSLLTTTRISFHLIIPFVFYFVYSQKSGSANACPHVEREVDIREMVSDASLQRLTTQHNELILTFENVSLFFLLLYSFSMCVLAVTALSFPLNMQILLKETSNGWYTMPRFVMAKTLADLPIELTMPMVSVAIAYVITGQPSSYLSWRMLSVTAVMTMCSLISQTQGLLFGAYFMNNVQAAVFVSQASTLPWIMLSGFTTRVSELPSVLQWLSFGSIYRLGIESIVSVRYGFGMCPCNEEQVDGTPAKLIGIPDQLRSVMRYYMESYTGGGGDEGSDLIPTTTNNATSNLHAAHHHHQSASNLNHQSLITTTTQQPMAAANSSNDFDLFERMAATLSRANTYGVKIVDCHDVRPFIMSAREVDERTLPTFMLILLAVLIGLKVLLFFVVKVRTR